MCGVIGGFSIELIQMLDRIQHRGFNACGFVSPSTTQYARRVSDLTEVRDWGIGHVRYRTNGDSPNQPFPYKDSWMVFNGEIQDGDTSRLAEALYEGGEVSGAYSFIWMDEDRIIAGRDPMGVHPLYYAHTVYGIIAASETVADSTLFWHEVPPGHYVDLGCGGIGSFAVPRKAQCCFEDVYFSHVANRGTWERRRDLGQLIEIPENAEVVVPVPDSAIAAAESCAVHNNLPCINAIVRNRYAERTFITEGGQREKYTIIPEAIWDKVIVLVDDSIVRGKTMQQLVPKLKRYAKEVHVRVTFPPITHSCEYGVHITEAGCHEVPEADSVRFLSPGLFSGCTACITGRYPGAYRYDRLPGFGV